MKVLYIIRGVSGSGKTEFANTLRCAVYSADDFFVDPEDMIYKFDASKLPEAHKNCQDCVESAMSFGDERIAVANTFTREWEMAHYFDLAKSYGYTVFSLVVENRHGGKNSHGVPEDKVQEMRDRFEVKL